MWTSENRKMRGAQYISHISSNRARIYVRLWRVPQATVSGNLVRAIGRLILTISDVIAKRMLDQMRPHGFSCLLRHVVLSDEVVYVTQAEACAYLSEIFIVEIEFEVELCTGVFRIIVSRPYQGSSSPNDTQA